MSGVYHLEITESEAALKALLRNQKTASAKERIQLLYLLKSEQAQTIQQAASLLGRHRVTLQKWAETALRKRLEQPDGFESYAAIQQWLATTLGIVAPYKTVHTWVYYRLHASPKVVRPKSDKQNEAQLAAYKKTR